MRLSIEERRTIKESTTAFDPDAVVFLFGSRVHDDQRGGDIDLLIFSHRLKRRDRWSIRRRLCDILGNQKIDIVVTDDRTSPFVKLALEEAVQL